MNSNTTIGVNGIRQPLVSKTPKSKTVSQTNRITNQVPIRTNLGKTKELGAHLSNSDVYSNIQNTFTSKKDMRPKTTNQVSRKSSSSSPATGQPFARLPSSQSNTTSKSKLSNLTSEREPTDPAMRKRPQTTTNSTRTILSQKPLQPLKSTTKKNNFLGDEGSIRATRRSSSNSRRGSSAQNLNEETIRKDKRLTRTGILKDKSAHASTTGINTTLVSLTSDNDIGRTVHRPNLGSNKSCTTPISTVEGGSKCTNQQSTTISSSRICSISEIDLDTERKTRRKSIALMTVNIENQSKIKEDEPIETLKQERDRIQEYDSLNQSSTKNREHDIQSLSESIENELSNRSQMKNKYKVDENSLFLMEDDIKIIGEVNDSEFDWLDEFDKKNKSSEPDVHATTQDESFQYDENFENIKVATAQDISDEFKEFESSQVMNSEILSQANEFDLDSYTMENKSEIVEEELKENSIAIVEGINDTQNIKSKVEEEQNEDKFVITKLDGSPNSSDIQDTDSEEDFQVHYDPENPTKITVQLISQRCFTEEQLSTMSKDEITNEVLQLERIDLENCNIFEIDNLECYDCLTHLYLQHNHIKEISDQLIFLPELLFLALFDNDLVEVKQIKHLEKLQFLDISQNKIEKLDIEEIPRSIQYLNIAQNPFCMEDESYAYYRRKLIQYLPNLVLLDKVVVTLEERKLLNAPTDSNVFVAGGLAEQLVQSFPTYEYKLFEKSWSHSQVYEMTSERINEIQFDRSVIKEMEANREESANQNNSKKLNSKTQSKKAIKSTLNNTSKVRPNSTQTSRQLSKKASEILIQNESKDHDLERKFLNNEINNRKVYEKFEAFQKELTGDRKKYLHSLFDEASDRILNRKNKIQQAIIERKKQNACIHTHGGN